MCELECVSVIYVKVARITTFPLAGACGLVPEVINTVFFICIEGSYASERVFVQQISSCNSNYYAGAHQWGISRVNLTCRWRRVPFARVLGELVHMSDVCVTNHAAATTMKWKFQFLSKRSPSP